MKPPKSDRIDVPPTPAGLHDAVCIGLVDLGSQEVVWNNHSKIQRKVVLIFELPNEVVKYTKDGEPAEGPRWMSRKVTFSYHEKSVLFKLLSIWQTEAFTKRPEEFELETVLGKAATVFVTHTPKDDGSGGVWANLESIMPSQSPLPAESQTEHMFYDINKHRQEIPKNIPAWCVEAICKSQEWLYFVGPEARSPETPNAPPPPFEPDDADTINRELDEGAADDEQITDVPF